jgi:hypothetical protein
MSSRFVWRGLSNDITNWARPCLLCQQSKIHRHTRLLPQPIPILQQQFAHLHIDLMGPLQYSYGYNHILTIMIAHSNGWKQFHFLRLSRRHAHMLWPCHLLHHQGVKIL